ncbi:MAG TPA: hypothetical protein VFD58_26890 [Blastocatellia bacterium]|nr:hypothetical protein [Blastocatellia bacterium]
MGVDNYICLLNLRTYRETVLPSYEAFLNKKDPEPLIALLREAIRGIPQRKKLADLILDSEEIYEEAIGILDGSVYYNSKGDYTGKDKCKTTNSDRRRFAGTAAWNVMQALCIPYDKGIAPDQMLNTSPLIEHLYEHSKWIEDLVMCNSVLHGGTLKIPLGEWSELFTKEDVCEFNKQLALVPPPDDPDIRKRFDNLCTLVELPLEDPDLTLVHSLS